MTVPADSWVWATDGGFSIERGAYQLVILGDRVKAAQVFSPIALDLWGDSIGFPWPDELGYPNDWSWSSSKPISEESEQLLRDGLHGFWYSMDLLFRELPECGAWASEGTGVVIALKPGIPGRLKSGSRPDLPGTVLFDINCDSHHLLEALVHETAHRYFCNAEAIAPIVNPNHTQKYASPLRQDPRPLRGIFLAYHALAYICAYYRDLIDRTGTHSCLDEELLTLEEKRDEAEKVLSSAEQGLTGYGREFLDQTRRVANYVAV